MSQNRKEVLLISPNIGHGNPAGVLSIGKMLEKKGFVSEALLLNGVGLALLSFFHHRISQDNRLRKEYTKNSERVRNETGMLAIGLIQLFSWLTTEKLRLKNKIADFGIFIQEHLLGVIPEKWLQRWFPKGVFLAIPDVLPKQSGVKILEIKSTTVNPVVWNKTAYRELFKQGLRPILTAPFLPEGFIERGVNFCQKQLERKIFIKSSGSGC